MTTAQLDVNKVIMTHESFSADAYNKFFSKVNKMEKIDRMMTIEEANALRIKNETELSAKIIDSFSGYSLEEVIGAFLHVGCKIALESKSESFSADYNLMDKIWVKAHFSVEPVDQSVAAAIVEEAKEKGIL